jgi:hypothetical protein
MMPALEALDDHGMMGLISAGYAVWYKRCWVTVYRFQSSSDSSIWVIISMNAVIK